MRDNIEEQIARIMADAPSVDDHLAPYREQIGILEKQWAAAKTNRKRQAISEELNKLRKHISQFGGGTKHITAASPCETKKKKATEKENGMVNETRSGRVAFRAGRADTRFARRIYRTGD
jgi:hypothetical protein